MLSGWSSRVRLLAVVLAGTVLAAVALVMRGGTAPLAPQAPRLLVLVVFDQLRGDYLERWQSLFMDGGFRRLQTEGAWFQNCHYPYGHTVTAAGHASLLTGCSPDRHGIVGNEWFEPATGARVYCVASGRYEQVPPPVEAAPGSKRAAQPRNISPELLLAPTVGDVLKDATGGQARVVALSFKDRSAVLPAGHKPDACYWLDVTAGRFATSTYYRGRLHPWVAEFNQGRPADHWFGHSWDRFRSDLDYAHCSGPDDVEGEGKGTAQGRTFPHPLTGGLKEPGEKYYEALYNSPFGNDLLLDLVKRGVIAEHLGQGPAPDLLCVSFSSNDPIGHTWGPDSQEVLDVTLRSDRTMHDLLTFLDEQVGRDRYLLALSADHGVCPLPEVSRSRGIPAQRLGEALLTVEAEHFLDEQFPTSMKTGRWLEPAITPWIALSRQSLHDRRLEPAVVAEALARWLRRQPGIHGAWTRQQLEGSGAGDPLLERMRRSYHPERCGDLFVMPRPYSIFWGPFTTGTTHGTPHAYDTHVPLLVYGPGIAGGPRSEPVTPQAIAAIFSHFLGLPPPAAAEAPLPTTLLRERGAPRQ